MMSNAAYAKKIVKDLRMLEDARQRMELQALNTIALSSNGVDPDAIYDFSKKRAIEIADTASLERLGLIKTSKGQNGHFYEIADDVVRWVCKNCIKQGEGLSVASIHVLGIEDLDKAKKSEVES